MTAVAKLAAKWREEAADHDRHKDPLPASILRECADELEASLSPAELGGVEATVCVDAKPGFRHVIDVPPNVSLPVGTKLFTRKESS